MRFCKTTQNITHALTLRVWQRYACTPQRTAPPSPRWWWHVCRDHHETRTKSTSGNPSRDIFLPDSQL